MLKYISIVAIFLLATGIFSSGINMSYAQSNAIGQDGGGDAKQKIEQKQFSSQDSQCVNAGSVVLSALDCNNIAAQLNANTEALGPGPGQDQNQVTLCHIPPGNPDNPQTITVGAAAVPAHLAHGDTLGPCPPRP